MNRRKFMTATGSALTLAIAGCTSSNTDYEESGGGGDTTEDSEPEKKLELLNHELVRENEGGMAEQVKVTGTAKNVSGGQLGYAEVKAKFYDKDGALLDSFLDNINDFGAGEKWKFEVLYPKMGEDAQEVGDYKIAAGTNF